MSNVRGRIAVDVQFTDSTTSAGVQSLKTLTLQDATEYTSANGKVAIITGTVGTATVTVATSPSTYRDASGAILDFDTDEGLIRRVAFSAMGAMAVCENQAGLAIYSRDGRVGVSDTPGQSPFMAAGEVFQISCYEQGTATYTLVLYGT